MKQIYAHTDINKSLKIFQDSKESFQYFRTHNKRSPTHQELSQIMKMTEKELNLHLQVARRFLDIEREWMKDLKEMIH